MHNEKDNISFSDYVETYQNEVQQSIDFIGQDLDFYIELKANLIIKIAKKYFSRPKSINILDLGSGIGLTDHHLSAFFDNLHGVDVEEDVVKKAAAYNPKVKYSIYDSRNLPFENNSLEMVFAINVMHHVPPDQWKSIVKEMHRVVKPGGIAAVFEHNPLNPLTRLAVKKCEFDRDAVLLHKNQLKKIFLDSGFSETRGKYIVYFPFRGGVFRSAETFLSWIPLGAQFYLVGKK